jgi:D-sedoheptulose 7-phosphate isomerase
MGQDRITTALKEQSSLLESTFREQSRALTEFSTLAVATFNRGGRLLLVGNGALGAIANLVANQFLHRLSFERPSLPALSLGQNLALATTLVRDGQNRLYFSRQLRALATANDIVLILSDGQRDEALTDALGAARQIGCKTALLTQDKADLAAEPVDFCFPLKTASIPRTIEAILFFGHLLCELVEAELFGI